MNEIVCKGSGFLVTTKLFSKKMKYLTKIK